MVLLFGQNSESGDFVPVPGGQDFKINISCKVFEFQREHGNALLGGKGLSDFRVAAVYCDPGPLQVDGHKKRESLDMVPMDVGKDNVKMARSIKALGFEEIIAEFPKP